ncbi:MAG: efflux RND transporter periplasmic adaptor subunit [Thermoflavifilum aggregans]|nr:efflux RND transporter periplasmic adaptor subunit [Thermoflavifilum aggregans]
MKTIFLIAGIIILAWGIPGMGCRHDLSNKKKGETSQGVVFYTCPMHPQVRSDRPGNCPICGMTLVPVSHTHMPTGEEGLRSSDSSGTMPSGAGDTNSAPKASPMGMDAMQMIVLDPHQEMLAGIHTTPARPGRLSHTLWLTGTTLFDPQQVETLSAWFRGWITRLYVTNPGQYVRSGQPLYEIYSPDLLADEQTYLTVYRQWRNREITDSNLLGSLRQRLMRWGLRPDQIEALPSRASTGRLLVYSRGTGYLTQKYVQEGSYVNEGSPVMQLTRTATFWVQAQLDPEQISWLPHLKSIRIQLPAHPGHIFTGRIAFSNPVIQTGAQVYLLQIAFSAAPVRVQAGEMAYVQLELDPISASYPANLQTAAQSVSGPVQIPASALVYAFDKPVVWVHTKPHTYVMRKVQLGVVDAHKASIVGGLRPGEQVVDQGSYLLYSQYVLTYGSGVNMSGMQMSDMKMGGKSQSM